MAATRLITMHQNKGKSVAKSLSDRTDCAKNGEKTENGQFISSYACQAESVDEEFMLSKREYERLTGRHPKGNIIAYQIRQSFKPGEITPEEANQVGYETAMRFTKGNHAFIVATHTDKAHIHNHIIFNSTSLDCTHKFRDFFFVGLALQRLSDIICLEHGLSVIEKKKPSERVKRTTYPEKKSFRDDIRDAIDQILREGSAKDFDELLYKLEDAGYEIKRGKHISLKGKDQKRFIRLRSLGDGYTEDDLKKILIGEMEHAFYDNEKAEKQPKTYQRKKEDHEFDLLIDIQKKLAQGKGKYYVRFAKNFNTKQVAKAVLYLKQHDIRSYDDLEKNVKTATARFTKISASIKEKEKANINDVVNLFLFCRQAKIEIPYLQEECIVRKIKEKDDPILWATYLMYSQYNRKYSDEIRSCIEKTLLEKINAIRVQKSVYEYREFWWILIFNKCPFITNASQNAIDNAITLLNVPTDSGCTHTLVDIFKNYLQNSPIQFFDWDIERNDFLRTLTFKTHEKSIFKNYKENAISLAWGSI